MAALPVCDDSRYEAYYALDLLMTPGVTPRLMMTFLGRHKHHRYCVTKSADTAAAYAEFCQQNLAEDCTVNTVQFCGHPHVQGLEGAKWAAVANAPPRLNQSFPLIRQPAGNSAVVKACEDADADFKSSTVTAGATSSYDPDDKSRALASFMCLQRGKTQALNADRNLASRVLSVSERVGRSKALSNTLNAASSAGKVVGDTVGRLAPLAGAAIGVAVAPAVFGAAGIMSGAMIGHGTAKTFGPGANSPSQKQALTQVAETHVSRRNTTDSLLSAQDTAVWRCLTRPEEQCNVRAAPALPSMNIDKGITDMDIQVGTLTGGIASFLPPRYGTTMVTDAGTTWTRVDALKDQITQREIQNTEQAIAKPMCADSQNLRTSESSRGRPAAKPSRSRRSRCTSNWGACSRSKRS